MNRIGHEKAVLPRRDVIAGLTGLLATGCRGAARTPYQARTRPSVPLSHFGVDVFSTQDQWSRLTQAFAAARSDGLTLLGDPDARYRRDGPLTLDGVSFDGQGCTFITLSDGHNVLHCVGNGWRLANLRILGAATRRSSENLHNGVWIGDDDADARDFRLENVVVDAVAPGRGVGAAGVLFSNAHHGVIEGVTVRHSLADGVHITNGASDLAFTRILVEDTGDDGFAVVSYRSQRRICSNIRLSDAVSRRSAARGFSIVGAIDTVYERVRAEASSAAGVYLYGEGGFDTFGVGRCQVLEPIVTGCVTGRLLPTGFSNAAIILGGRDGVDTVDGQELARGTADCLIRKPVVNGGGAACTAAISTHEYAIRPRIIGAHIRGTGADRGAKIVDGIEIGGQSVVVEAPALTDISGLAIAVTKTASGDCIVDTPQVMGSRLRPGAINSYVYVDDASALHRINIRDGRFSGGPKRLCIGSLPAGRVILTANRMR